MRIAGCGAVRHRRVQTGPPSSGGTRDDTEERDAAALDRYLSGDFSRGDGRLGAGSVRMARCAPGAGGATGAFLGIPYEAWSHVHIVASIAFCAAAASHLGLNWLPLVRHFRGGAPVVTARRKDRLPAE